MKEMANIKDDKKKKGEPSLLMSQTRLAGEFRAMVKLTLDKIDLYIFVDSFSHLTKEFSNYISSDFDTFLKSMKN